MAGLGLDVLPARRDARITEFLGKVVTHLDPETVRASNSPPTHTRVNHPNGFLNKGFFSKLLARIIHRVIVLRSELATKDVARTCVVVAA